MTNPRLLATPFAENGVKNDIPESTAAKPQLATLNSGFPDITQTPISQGGVPPERADFNGVLNLYGEHIVHLSKGLPYAFDGNFAQKIGGYPLHARVMLENGYIVRNTMVNNINNPNTDMTGWSLGDSEISDANVILESGRTQREKNRDVVNARDFGIIPNSPEDQTDKMDLLTDYLRANPSKCYFPAGVINVSCNKVKKFGVIGEADYEEVFYAVDISGLDIVGVVKGYRNANGTIFKNIGANAGVAFMQNLSGSSSITYNIDGFRFDGFQKVLRMTYSVNSIIRNLFATTSCIDGIQLGEYTFDAGPLFNIFENINISVSGIPLDLRGKDWNNANQFLNCYFQGGKESSIWVVSGYGALANTFIGGEIRDLLSSPSTGIHLRNTRSTNFIGVYFEPNSHAISFENTRDLSVKNCVFGTTKKTNTQSGVPCFIWHKSGTGNIKIDGGSVFLDNSNGSQDDMTFFHSDNPSSCTLTLISRTVPTISGAKGFEFLKLDLVSQLSAFEGSYNFEAPVSFSTSGGSIDGLLPSSSVKYSINGRSVTATIHMGFNDGTIFGNGEYYPRLAFNPKNSTIGSSRIGGGGGYGFGGCFIRAGNRNLFLYKPVISNGEVSSSVISKSNLTGLNKTGNNIYAQITYDI